jgi:signal peptidase II
MVFAALAAASFGLDQLTKVAAGRSLRPDEPLPLFGSWIRLTLTHNTESAFGLISSHWLLVATGAAVCVGLLAYIAIGGALRQHPRQAAALGLIFGGSFGNLLDRLRTRAVTDFVDLQVWPVFNVADIAITAGFALLAVCLIRR